MKILQFESTYLTTLDCYFWQDWRCFDGFVGVNNDSSATALTSVFSVTSADDFVVLEGWRDLVLC